jgi:hypothetical protein
LSRKFSWFKPFPNQFHRLAHNSHFMTNDMNSLGVKSLEGLEKGNFTTQVMDAHHTYKGNRKKANKGVFKLLRLKSSRLLRSYRRKPPTRVQRCSLCKRTGHNALSKSCPARAPAQDEDAEEQAAQEDGVPGPAEGAVPQVVQEAEGDRGDTGLDDSVLDVEDLLGNSSDEDLF